MGVTTAPEFHVKSDRLPTEQKPKLFGITYRNIQEPFLSEGECVSISGSDVEFMGRDALPVGQAAEVQIRGVKGLTPSMTAYIQVLSCDHAGSGQADGRYQILGTIKAIRCD